MWTADEHMRTLGYSDRHRQDTGRRNKVAKRVLSMTKWELEVRRGKQLARAPWVHIELKVGKRATPTSPMELEGLVLRPNKFLWSGVRKPDGKLGSNFGWAPAELAKVNTREK